MKTVYSFNNGLLELVRETYINTNSLAFILLDENGEEWGYITTNIPGYTDEMTIAVNGAYMSLFTELYSEILKYTCSFQMYRISNSAESYMLYTLKPEITEIPGIDDNYKTIKQRRFEIINEVNPANNSLTKHTWIRSDEDILTYPEALENDGYNDDPFDIVPDFKRMDVEKSLASGTAKVFSSHPIDDVTFVTPSEMEARNYAGSGEVYSKVVKLTDIAWIDSIQGQYAKVDLDGTVN